MSDAVTPESGGQPPLPKSEWKVRRRLLIASVVFCGLCIAFILGKGNDAVLYQNALFLAFGAGVTFVGQYVFAASWDDKNWLEAMRTRLPPQLLSDFVT